MLLIPTITPYQNLMKEFKAQFIHPVLESPKNIGFHSSIPEDVVEVTAGAADNTQLEVIVVAEVDQEDMVELAMVITNMNSPAGTDHLWHMPVYTLQTNV